MQLCLHLDERTSLLKGVDGRLRTCFGHPDPCLQLDPVSQLVLAMIGVRTYGAISKAAFEVLVRRFQRWDRVRDAPAADVYNAIRPVTYSEVKVRHLQAALRIITITRDGLALEFLGGWRVEDALAWLERLPGVGRKVAAATLNFSTLKMKALVIDTHYLRVSRRLGLVGPRADYREAYDRIMPFLPTVWTADDIDDHHRLMKILGQTICRPQRANCDKCPLNDLCKTSTRTFDPGRFESIYRDEPTPVDRNRAGSGTHRLSRRGAS